MTRPRHVIAACAAVGLGVLCVGACGGSGTGHEAARVGADAITRGAVAHWGRVLSFVTSGSIVGSASRQRALEYLIASRWLVGEAERRGIHISDAEVRHRAQQLQSSGIGEARAIQQAAGETTQDFELQARDELASTELHSLVIRSTPAVSSASIAAYYARHRSDFMVPKERWARYAYRRTRAAAETAKREAEAGKSLTSPEQRRHKEEFVTAPIPPQDAPQRAVDASRLHAISGPFHISHLYALYQVVKVVPAHVRPLPAVEPSIRSLLAQEQSQQALARFAKNWTAAWRSRTDCSSDDVVPACRQYAGPPVTLDPFSVKPGGE
jgi:parvulin-like peptidyl-prolyl isomerase